MTITVNGIRLYYERFEGSGADTTVLLHGWGADTGVMRGIFNFLSARGNGVVMLDLPYFGASEPPPESFGIYEYAGLVHAFLRQLGLERVDILGHSFGGRIALILAAEHGAARRLILTDAAGVKPKRGLRYRLRVWWYKLKKRLGSRPKNAGSADYKALPDSMKPVFVRVVNTHLDRLLPKIKCPTLLIWGAQDRDTPLYMAQKMRRKIPDAGLVVLENAGHYSFLDCPYDFYTITDAFLQRS